MNDSARNNECFRQRRAGAGFTLIELTVALAAGLVVALGIVGLSKEATRTFHDEVRSSAAEAALRTAVDRLRADLQRASFMSTANIQTDPMIAFAPGTSPVSAAALHGLRQLAGIHVFPNTASTNGLALSTSNGLAPLAIEIGGNMTSSEQFEVQAIMPAAAGGCTTILLSATSPAIFRVLNNPAGGAPSTNADLEMSHLFQPASVNTYQFIVRIVDDTGHSQFMPTCPAVQAAGLKGAGGILAPYVVVQGTPLMASVTKVGALAGNAAGRAWVNPVQIVRWEIVGSASTGTTEPARTIAALGNMTDAGVADATKYDLVRSYVDATDTVVPETMEVVAEYAVDLDFAFSVDTSVDITGATPTIVPYEFGNGLNLSTADNVFAPAAGIPTPQRIRAVRARIVTRTAQADRSVNVAAGAAGTPQYLYRFCLVAGGCTAGKVQWARARTMVTEVSIPNQARNFY